MWIMLYNIRVGVEKLKVINAGKGDVFSSKSFNP